MAIAYAAAGAGVSANATTALDPRADGSVASGHILVLHTIYRGTAEAPSTPGGWTLLRGPDNIGTTVAGRSWVFGKIADGTEDTTANSLGTSAAVEKAARIYRFTGRISGTIQQLISSASFAYVAHGTDPQGVSVTTAATGDRAVCFTMQTDNNVLEAISGMSGGTWVEHVTYSVALTTGLCMDIQSCIPTNDPGTVSGGAETVTNDPAATVGFAIAQQPTVISRTLTAKDVTETAQALSKTHIHYRTITPKAETDAVQALVKTKQKTLGFISETDAPQSVDKDKRKGISFASETDQAQILPLPIKKSLTVKDETDSAQTLSKNKSKAVTAISETDFSQAISYSKAIHKTLTAVDETESAQAISYTKTIYKSFTAITETDVAQVLHYVNYESINNAVEIDTAETLSITHIHYRSLSPSSESDSARTITFTQGLAERRALVSWIEFDIPQSMGALSITPVAESDTAQVLSITHVHYRSLTATTETDTARAANADKAPRLISAIESEVAQELTFEQGAPHFVNLTNNTESDIAQILSITKIIYKSLSSISEIDSGQTLAHTKAIFKTLGSAIESDSAQTITYAQASSGNIIPAIESDSARALNITHIHYRTISAISESDLAQTLSYVKPISKVLIAVAETDNAGLLSITHIHYRTLTATQETDLAWYVTIGGVENILPALETDLAISLKIPKITTITETDSARTLSYKKVKTNIAAIESDVARAINFVKTIYKTIFAANESDSSYVLNLDKHKQVVNAASSDISQALTIRKSALIGTLSESDQAITFFTNKAVSITPRSETDIAYILVTAGTRTLFPIVETEVAQALTKYKIYPIIYAIEIDKANQFPLTIRPALETDIAILVGGERPIYPEQRLGRPLHGRVGINNPYLHEKVGPLGGRVRSLNDILLKRKNTVTSRRGKK